MGSVAKSMLRRTIARLVTPVLAPVSASTTLIRTDIGILLCIVLSIFLSKYHVLVMNLYMECLSFSDICRTCRCVAPRGYVTAHNPFETAVPPDHFSLNPENVSLLTAPVHATLARRLDENMCFSRDGMDLSLDGPNPSLYQQGDSYEEHGLQVSDHQPENFVRRVSIHYSSPLGSIFWEPNTHYVYYTVQTPWLPLKANITKTRYSNCIVIYFHSFQQLLILLLLVLGNRKVVVNDVDECSYTGDVERFRHKCSPEAR